MNILRHLFRQEIFLKALLMGFLCLYLTALTLGFMFRGPNHLFDGTTALLGFAIGTVLLISLKLAEEQGALFAQLAMMVVVFLLFICLRILGYLFTPNLVVFPFGESIGSREVNSGFLYLLLGTIVMIIGFFAAELVMRRHGPATTTMSVRSLEYPMGVMLMVFLFVMAGDWVIAWWSGINLFGNLRAETNNAQMQFLKAIFGIDTAYFMFLACWVLRNAKGGEGAAYSMIGFVSVIYLFYMAFNGSRSGGLRIVLMFLAVLLATRGNLRASLWRYCSIILLVSVVSFSLYPLATQIRIDKRVEFLKTAESIVFLERTKDGEDLYKDPTRLFFTIANRLAGTLVDYTILVLSQPGDRQAKAKYMNLGYAVKNIINYCVPGSVFIEAELSTSRVLAIIYRDFTEEYVKHHGYFSEFWTAWGLAYVLFGWGGGLVAILIAGFLIHIGYALLVQSSGKFSAYLGSWYLFLVPPLFYTTSGLDHYVTTILVYVLQAGVILSLSSAGFSTARCIECYLRPRPV